MMDKICVVTIVDSISATSMPVNEFVLYRRRKGLPLREILVSYASSGRESVEIPEDVSLYIVEGNSFRKILKEIKKGCIVRGEKLVIHLHAQKSALAFFRAAAGLGLRPHTLFTVHSTYSSRDFKYRISSIMCSLAAKRINCVSGGALADYSGFVRFFKGRNLFAIRNGVDVERVNGYCTHQDDSADVNTLVCVGRIIPIKNQAFLVGLLPYLPDMKLLLVGAENSDYDIRTLAKELGVVSRVEFTGLVSRENVYGYMHRGRIYVSASTVEGLPVSVLEAMACGMVPLLSDIGAHREIESECKMDCILPLDKNVWISRIKKLKEDSSALEALSAKARQCVGKDFSLERMHEEYLKVYQELS